MKIVRFFSVGKEPKIPERRVRISGYVPWLVITSVGLLLTVALPVAIFFIVVPLPILAAGALYLLGLVAAILVISGAENQPVLWIARLLLPLPAAGLAWWGLAAMGL
ncbi:hypothetical protein [Pelagibacterium sp.]|uniref:hypothetical protein n=1 Tax=Pelagibacterium sp. TaxID=1967288 RepID=UPI003BA983DB